ncbi:MAG: type II toxin-antitoxin system RelE/ParE family toxin [Synergistaceae bacterium]|nr:type II toxin-antitoxin system RelE/ParE family toxin [Synergistaceae bacterium]
MRYTVELTDKARKLLDKMDPQVSRRIRKWINDNLEGCENPRKYGKALTGKLKGYWRYETGNYRIIADIRDNKLIILITKIGHRREIYRLNS